MKIDIRVTEVLSKIVSVNASSLTDAFELVEDMYKAQEIVLDNSDFNGNLVIEKKEINFNSRKDFLINKLIEYLIIDEKKHYEEYGNIKPKNHIYLIIQELQECI